MTDELAKSDLSLFLVVICIMTKANATQLGDTSESNLVTISKLGEVKVDCTTCCFVFLRTSKYCEVKVRILCNCVQFDVFF